MDIRKRGFEGIGNGSFKKSKLGFFASPDSDSLSSGIGGKLKPCTKYFSTAGCPFGESCHFLHYYPGGYNAVAQVMNLEPIPAVQTTLPNGSSSAVKSRLCNKYNTPEGCKFGDKCHFAHGEWELGRPIPQSNEDPRDIGVVPSRSSGRVEQPPVGAASTFGALATAKISVDASLTGAIIGKGGLNSKQISRETGVKLAIRDHASDSSLKNIELEGTFEQINQASVLVKKLVESIGLTAGPAKASSGMHALPVSRASNYKTKLCENLAKGSCTFGERCHFAHGEADLRKSSV